MTTRSSRGATLALIVSCTMIIIIVGIGIFFLVRLFGGGRELQHAVDSGNLNLAKQALVAPGANRDGVGVLRENNVDEAQFIGVVDTAHGNTINLNCVNRVFAQSALVAANAKAMVQEGSSIGTTESNAHLVEDAADLIGQRLGEALSDRSVMSEEFSGMAHNNSVRMLRHQGQNAGDINHEVHMVSYTDRGLSSNVRIQDNQIPSAIVGNVWANIKSTKTVNVAGVGNFFIGYLDGIHFLDRDSHFVPLKNAQTVDTFRHEQPHLISTNTFNNDQTQSASPGFSWANPVPNAFQDRGDTAEARTNHMAQLSSCSVSRSLQPADGFIAAIPRGFVRIKNLPCANGSGAAASSGQDVFVFLMQNPQTFSSVGNETFFQTAPGDSLQNVVTANQNGQTPSNADCQALTPPASAAQCKQLNSFNGPVDNNNYGQYPNFINSCKHAYGLSGGGGGPTQTVCASAVELANLQLLTQRAHGDDSVALPTASSGLTNVPASRGPLASGQFQFTTPITMAQAVADTPLVAERIRQRCYQIFPSFNGDLNQISGWSSLGIPMGTTAVIYFSGNTNQQTGVQTGNLVLNLTSSAPSWLQPVAAVLPDGKTASYDQIGHVFGAGPSGPTYNVNGDWGFPTPYDFGPGGACYKKTLSFTPSTGYRGLLGEVTLGSCVGDGAGCGVSHGDRAQGNFGNVNVNNCQAGPCCYTGPC